MSRKLADDQGIQLPFGGSTLWASLLDTVPLVARLCAYPEKGMVSLKVSYRGQHDWLAVMKRYNDDGRVDVCFGSGPDMIASLLGLERAVDQDKWRPDKWMNKGD